MVTTPHIRSLELTHVKTQSLYVWPTSPQLPPLAWDDHHSVSVSMSKIGFSPLLRQSTDSRVGLPRVLSLRFAWGEYHCPLPLCPGDWPLGQSPAHTDQVSLTPTGNSSEDSKAVSLRSTCDIKRQSVWSLSTEQVGTDTSEPHWHLWFPLHFAGAVDTSQAQLGIQSRGLGPACSLEVSSGSQKSQANHFNC